MVICERIYRCLTRAHQDHLASNLDALRRDVDTDVHTQAAEELLDNLCTDINNGLSTVIARRLLKQHGPNALTPPRKTPICVRLFRRCCSGFSLLIWIGAFLCFGSYVVEYLSYGEARSDNVWLGVVLVILIVVTGLFSYYQEARSSRIMESFQQMLPQKTNVLRDGATREIYVTEVVEGDIVLLKPGDRVPADIRILECQGLKVDNASITGESIALIRTKKPSLAGSSIIEAENMAFFSTSVVEGTGKGVVVNRGDNTVMGRVARLTSRLSPRPTPLSNEIHLFMRLISCWAVFLGVTFFATSLAVGYGLIESAVYLIGIIVANVPEGLVATVAVSLSLTAKRMANKNCLVKNLEAIESLGCTAVICSDKTGTLTQNKMTVRHMWYNGKLKEVMASDTWKKYRFNPGFQNLARVASLCNRAEWAKTRQNVNLLPINKRKVLGDASDAALLKCMEILVRGGAEAFRRKYTKVFEIPFNSTDKFQAIVHISQGKHLVSLKGAPERVLERCSTVALDGETKNLNDDIRSAYTESCHVLANNGERVLGFADLELPVVDFPQDFEFQGDPPNFPLENLRLIGLMSMMDPPRPNVPDAVYKCRCAGIKVIMVTGDHPDTARAIARYVGIITDEGLSTDKSPQILHNPFAQQQPPPVKDSVNLNDTDLNDSFNNIHSDSDTEDHSIVVTGMKLRDLQPEQLDELISKHQEIVFARTSPTQKLQIVESCQRLHMITTVTGDGVNDSPALKKADIGIAMGMAGSDVSRQVADLVLLDDNFATIISGIEEGRKIFDNLKSSIAYTLASNVPEITPFLAFITLGIPLPVGVICILCIDIGTDMWPAISFAYEESEFDILQRKPRMPHVDHLVSRRLVFLAYGQIGIIEACAGFFTYFVVMAENGFLPMRLLGLREYWDSAAVNDLTDSFGQEWTYEQRKVLEYTCHTAFFVSIVIVQCADALVCKTSKTSLFHHGMNNWVLNFGIIFQIAMACFVSYAPYMDMVLKTYPLKATWWLPGVPYAILILVYDELRKLWIRRHPGGWWERETTY